MSTSLYWFGCPILAHLKSFLIGEWVANLLVPLLVWSISLIMWIDSGEHIEMWIRMEENKLHSGTGPHRSHYDLMEQRLTFTCAQLSLSFPKAAHPNRCTTFLVNKKKKEAPSLHETTSHWLHGNYVPKIGCHYFWPRLIALPKNTIPI
jgi:hypothetical protein